MEPEAVLAQTAAPGVILCLTQRLPLAVEAAATTQTGLQADLAAVHLVILPRVAAAQVRRAKPGATGKPMQVGVWLAAVAAGSAPLAVRVVTALVATEELALRIVTLAQVSPTQAAAVEPD